MNKSDFYVIEDNSIKLCDERKIDFSSIEKVEVKITPNKKGLGDEVANTVATALSSSGANGNEEVFVDIVIKTNENNEIIRMNEKPVIRFNLDYHELVRQARELQKMILNDIKG